MTHKKMATIESIPKNIFLKNQDTFITVYFKFIKFFQVIETLFYPVRFPDEPVGRMFTLKHAADAKMYRQIEIWNPIGIQRHLNHMMV